MKQKEMVKIHIKPKLNDHLIRWSFLFKYLFYIKVYDKIFMDV